MKKIIYTTIAILFSHALQAQIFWTEAFENSCTANCPAEGSNTGNGAWAVTNTGANGDFPNTWYISCAENGQAAGQCGAGCASDESLHVGSQTIGDIGAAYDAGGLCGIFYCTNTDRQAESPSINCTGYSTITLSFNYIENGQTTLDNATLWWYDGAVWTQLFDLAKTFLCGSGQGLWTAYSVVLPVGANNNPNVKIGFRWVNDDDGAGTDPSFAVDDITLSVVAAGNTITTGTITGSPFCACATVNVPFTSTGTFTAGNTYTAQLSNSAGSFAAPVSIGTLTSTANSGTIACVIPCNTPTGTLYRIRVISSTPAVTGSSNTVNLVVNAPPAAPTASVTIQPTCAIPTGTIVVTAPIGATIQYSNGGAYQASATFTGLVPGSYNVTAQNTATGCTSTATVLTVNAVPTPPSAPTASVTVQPTCAVPTGTIVVSAPVGATIQYSNGGAYQASGTFTGLAPGNYNMTAQNMTTGCISAVTILTVNPIPTPPAAPTASVTVQPTCAIPTGTIIVSAPLGATIQYSNGGAYQASATFTGLAPGNYNITAQNTLTGCISTVTMLVVNAAPGAPATPTASVTVQPTCAIPTGTIVVTAPVGATIQYSVGGAYQASGTFSGLAPGSYNVTAQNTSTGCISTSTVLTVNAVPTAPAAPTASVTVQPTCAIPTGTIVVTAPVGAMIQYSVGGAYQASGTFSGLAPGSYNITAQNTSTGCISTATVLTVNAVPTAPAAPTASVTVQPTCAIPTGTIVVTAPVGATIQYSVGGAYQASGTFTGLAPGSYNVTAQNTSTGCISTATVLTVNAVPTAPAAPTASVTVQPTCAIPTGTIVVTAPVGATIQYSVGLAYQASGTFAGLAANSYNVTAQNTSNGCISTATILVLNAPPGAPAAPTASVTVQPTCAIPAGTIVVTAPVGATIQYSNGGAYQASGTFSGLAPGSYNITAQDMGSGCISSITALTVNPIPTAPTAPTASVTVQPTCTVSTGTIVITAPVGGTIQYSNGGAYQASGTFSGLAPGSYNITAQDMGSGCISAITAITVNPIPTSPAAPTASVAVQPTCAVPTGTIVVTAPVGASIQYSNGGAYQASGTFSGLAANSYSITAQDMTSGCISTVTVLVVNPAPGAPGAPTASVTVLATCAVPTGTITVTAPVGATIEYSNGGAYQASGTFSGLAPGSYNITAQDAVSGCTSSVTVVVVNATVGAPAAPTASVTTQPTCAVPTGTIVVTAPVGATIEYSNGGAYQSSGTFSNLSPGNYTITAQDMLTGCISSPTSVTVNALPIPEVVDAGLDAIIPAGGNTTLTATGLGTFSWVTGETTPSIIVSPTITTTYCVTLTDANGCVDTDCATVSIAIDCGEIFIPTIFSPNEDLNNDNLVIHGVVGCVETYNFSVYDRWGEMVFDTSDPLIYWDGTYKGKAMNTGVYFYKLIAIKIDGTTVNLSGNTTLVR